MSGLLSRADLFIIGFAIGIVIVCAAVVAYEVVMVVRDVLRRRRKLTGLAKGIDEWWRAR